LGSLEDAVWKTSKTIRSRKLRNAFNRYKKKTEEAKRFEYVKTKVHWFNNLRNNKSLDIVFDAWKHYIKIYKNAKKFLNRSIKGVDRSIKDDAFVKWKGMVYS
jgi:hypothetical protein